MTSSFQTFTIASLVGLALVSSQARAADILSNLSGNTAGNTTVLQNGRVKAISFTMGAADAFLGSVVLRLQNFDAPDDLLTVELRNDTGGIDPGGTVLLSFTTPSPQGTAPFDYTFAPNAAFTLQASSKYWLYVAGGEGGLFLELKLSRDKSEHFFGNLC